MSGGSMEHLFLRVKDAEFSDDTELRRNFRKLLDYVAEALREIELVDSDDMSPGDEDESIRACFYCCAILSEVKDASK